MPEQVQPAAFSSGGLGLVKGLGLFDSMTIVVGSMIGSGIYIVSADTSNQVQSPGLPIILCLIIVRIGLPVYLLWRMMSRNRNASAAC